MKYCVGLINKETGKWLNAGVERQSAIWSDAPLPIPSIGDTVAGKYAGLYRVEDRRFSFTLTPNRAVVVHLFCREVKDGEQDSTAAAPRAQSAEDPYRSQLDSTIGQLNQLMDEAEEPVAVPGGTEAEGGAEVADELLVEMRADEEEG